MKTLEFCLGMMMIAGRVCKKEGGVCNCSESKQMSPIKEHGQNGKEEWPGTARRRDHMARSSATVQPTESPRARKSGNPATWQKSSNASNQPSNHRPKLAIFHTIWYDTRAQPQTSPIAAKQASMAML